MSDQEIDFLNHHATHARALLVQRATTTWDRVSKTPGAWMRRHPVWSAAIGAAAVGLVVVGVWTTRSDHRSNGQAHTYRPAAGFLRHLLAGVWHTAQRVLGAVVMTVLMTDRVATTPPSDRYTY